jgi:hypothetical protein
MTEAHEVGFFDVPRARWSDPQTSKLAANSIALTKLTETQERVLTVLRWGGPATDDEIEQQFAH